MANFEDEKNMSGGKVDAQVNEKCIQTKTSLANNWELEEERSDLELKIKISERLDNAKLRLLAEKLKSQRTPVDESDVSENS